MSNSMNGLFQPGKITILTDGSFGSSGKAKMASYIAENSDNWTFACNTFAPQAGHTVRIMSGEGYKQYFYQTLNSCAYMPHRFEKIYLGPGAMIEMPAFFREMEENNIPRSKIGISPAVAILQGKDAAFERGEVDLDGNVRKTEGTNKKGSTCLPASARVVTEDGIKTIKWVVDTKYAGRVLSLENGELKFNKVINHWAKPNVDKQWVLVTVVNQKAGALTCTSDHQCACLEDPLRPEIKYVEAGSLIGKYVVRYPVNTNNNLNDNNLYNDEQVACIIGTLLGDSSIHKDYLVCDHGHKQEEYALFKQSLFGGHMSKHRSGWKKDDAPAIRIAGKVNAQTRLLGSLLYTDGRKSPIKVLDYADERSLAFWYMDDGTLVKPQDKSPHAVLCTDSFNDADHTAIISWFKDKFDITDVSVSYRNRISIGVAGSNKMFGLIAKYVHQSMRYKLPDEYANAPYHEFNVNKLQYAASLVLNVRDVECASKLYDIEVENAHNFIANRTVVHNCHGVGACTVRKVLRRSDAVYAKDIKELSEFMCDVPGEIMVRLDRGEAGFGEIAQGFPLSINHAGFLGHTTSRNCNVAQFMSDMFLPTKYAGNVIVNFRTYPIRINSNKYIGKDGKFLTWDEVRTGVPHEVLAGNSGSFYPDSTELDWDKITDMSGSRSRIFEITSVTKLPRRVATFSRQNLIEALRYNDTGSKLYVTINFMNYVDAGIANLSGGEDTLTEKCKQWISDNITPFLPSNAKLLLIGTGSLTNQIVVMNSVI